LDAKAGLTRLRQLWGGDSIMSHLSGASVERMLPYVSFASVPAERELIAQDESGDYLVVLLQGSISVLRKQEWGEVLVLATVNPGEMLGEMSLLDGGVRFSSCITRSECDIAILTAEGLDRMILGEPQIAASFIALLARKLSLRLRIVSARLGGRNT
jgi:CRP-like cAMP-binding protein